MKEFFKDFGRDRQFFRKLFTLALPIMIQNFIVSSLNMVDTLMVGAVGENEIAAVGIANQVFFMLNLLIIGISAGACMFISQYWGNGDKVKIKKVCTLGVITLTVSAAAFMICALVIPDEILGLFTDDAGVIELGRRYIKIVCISYIPTGLSFFFAGVLRSTDNAKLPMIVSAFAIAVNTFFNYMFIFGNFGAPKMGVEGAALATLIARICECIAIMFMSFKKSSPLRGRLSEYFGLDKAFVRVIMKSAVPVILNEACWGLGMTCYTAAYGRINTAAIAAMQICNTILNLMMVACFSVSNAALVMVGHEIGAGKREKAKKYAHRYALIALLIGLLMGVSLYAFSSPILSLFNVSDDVRTSAATVLIIFAVVSPVRALNNTFLTGIFRGGGDASFGLWIEMVSIWCIGVPLAFLGAIAWHLPVEQVVMLTCAEEVFKVIACLIRLKSGKWLNDLTASK